MLEKLGVQNTSCREFENYINNLSNMINVSDDIFHDFKNTLAVISGLTQLSLLESESRQVKENLEIINKFTFECRDAIDKYYSFTDSCNKKDIQIVSLKKILLSLRDMLKYEFNDLNTGTYHIKTNIDIETVGQIYGNEYKLKHAILNIILNAIQSMYDKGGTLNINLHERDECIILQIEDTGIGIPKENLSKIFEPKFTTKARKGTGLGLVITKDIIEENDGKIFVESQVGIGTRFTLKFPSVNFQVV